MLVKKIDLFSLGRYLRKLTISQKFYFIITVVCVFLILEFVSFWFAMSTMSAIRSFVGGEGLWSKAQKESLISLLQFSQTFKESDYQDFLESMDIPSGDHIARTELEKVHPNFEVVRSGFIQGDNNPDDVAGMIFLYKNFRHIRYIEEATAYWAQGDVLLEKQRTIGVRMHDIIASSTDRPYQQSEVQSALRPLIREVYENDRQLTPLQDNFSITLGEASRKIGLLLLSAILVLTLILGVIALRVALFISKLVSKVDEAKSDFVALAAHQLRSPLMFISLSIEMLRNLGFPKSAEEKDTTEGISREVTQMTSLVESILNVLRIEFGTISIEPKMIDIIALAREQVRSVALLARSKGVEIIESYSEKTYVLMMDQTLTQIIFQNLLSNAVKYTPRGGKVTISITLNGETVSIKVVDTGYGIPLEQQRNIFSKLYRADNVSKRDSQGTGLGLYIVKSIGTEAGGSIWFTSEENAGTTFTVQFPRSGMIKTYGNAKLQ